MQQKLSEVGVNLDFLFCHTLLNTPTQYIINTHSLRPLQSISAFEFYGERAEDTKTLAQENKHNRVPVTEPETRIVVNYQHPHLILVEISHEDPTLFS